MSTKQKMPFIPLTETEQSAFCRTDETLLVKPLSEEFSAVVSWQNIPEKYHHMYGQ